MANATQRYTFVLSWQDEESSLNREFFLHIFYDNTIELVDMKNGKLFLKRVKCGRIKRGKVLVGDTLNIFSRQMEVVGYGDVFTRDAHESAGEKAVGLLTLDSMDRIIDTCEAIINLDCKITKMKMVQFQQDDIKGFLFDRRHHTSLVKKGFLLLAKQLLVIEITGIESQDKLQEIINLQLTSPEETEETSSRTAIYGSHSDYQYQLDKDLFFPLKKAVPKIALSPTLTFTDCTLAIIKPHAVEEGIFPKIMRKILAMNYKITAIKMHQFRRPEAEELFAIYRGVLPEFKEMIDSFTLSPSIGLVVTGFGADTVSSFRQAVGPRDPTVARLLRPQTIRAEFGSNIAMNVIHCTDLDEDGIPDCINFFNL